MKLKNKKTGEIVDAIWWDEEVDELCVCGDKLYFYNSLAELNAEWEDYEELNYHYCLDGEGKIIECHLPDEDYEDEKEIGNYFETKEEAEKAVEKLKALTRLKDKGFRFEGWTFDDGLRISICTNTDSDGIYDEGRKEMKKDLDLFFGGEE